ncbi:MAG: hypothetical protein Q9170_000004 [Blastenia crenularia]
MDVPAWSLGSSPLPATGSSSQETYTTRTPNDPHTQQMSHSTNGATPSRRMYFARLLHEAHDDHRRKTRDLEICYNALRQSLKILKRRQQQYCNELETELSASERQIDIHGSHKHAVSSSEARRMSLDEEEAEAAIGEVHMRNLLLEFSQVALENRTPDLSGPDSQPPNVKQTVLPQSQSRSGVFHHPQPQHPSTSFSGRVLAATSQEADDLPSPPRSSPLSDLRTPQGSPKPVAVPSLQTKTRGRHASLPTTKQLSEICEQSRQRLASTKPIRINIVPPTPPQSPQDSTNAMRLPPPVRIADFASQIPQSTPTYTDYRRQTPTSTAVANFSFPRSPTRADGEQRTRATQRTSTHRLETAGSLVNPGTQGEPKGQRLEAAPRAKLQKRKRVEVGRAR